MHDRMVELHLLRRTKADRDREREHHKKVVVIETHTQRIACKNILRRIDMSHGAGRNINGKQHSKLVANKDDVCVFVWLHR